MGGQALYCSPALQTLGPCRAAPSGLSISTSCWATSCSPASPSALPHFFTTLCTSSTSDISKSSTLVSGWVGLPPPVAAVIFTTAFGGACYALPQAKMDVFNGVLVAAMMVAFGVSTAISAAAAWVGPVLPCCYSQQAECLSE